MSEMRWELDVKPTEKETYEAMLAAGRAGSRSQDRIQAVALSLFICFFAPMGATMIAWVFVALAGGPALVELPVFALPVTFALFGGVGFWLMRRQYFAVAQLAVRSRFGSLYRVTIDDSGIVFSTDHSRWSSGWADVEAVRGGKSTIAVCISAVALPVSRTAFHSPQDADAALAAMQRWQEAA